MDQVLFDFHYCTHMENPVEDNKFEHPKNGEAREVSGVDYAGIEQVTPVMCVNEILRVGRTNHGERDTKHRHRPKREEFLSNMTASGLAPGPTSVERIRRDGADDVADERGFDLTFDDLEPVDEGDDDNRHGRRDNRHRGESNQLSPLVALGPRSESVYPFEHGVQLTPRARSRLRGP